MELSLAPLLLLFFLGLMVLSAGRSAPGAWLQALLVAALGALGSSVALAAVVWLGRLPRALAEFEAGVIAARQVPWRALRYYSWAPLLLPAFYLFAIFGALAAVNLWRLANDWRRLS